MSDRPINNDPNSASYDFDNLKRKPSRIRDEFTKGKSVFVVVAALIILTFILFRIDDVLKVLENILSILAPLFYGLVFAFLLNPLMKFFERNIKKILKDKIKKPSTINSVARGVGIFLAVALVITLLVLVLNMMIPELYRSIRSLVYVLPVQLDKLTAYVNSLTKTSTGSVSSSTLKDLVSSFETWLRQDLTTQSSAYMSKITDGLTGVVGGLLNAIIGLIIAVYILISKEKFAGQCKKVLYALCKTDRANFFLSITRKSNEVFGGFLVGKIIDSIIIGVLCFIGMSIFGFTNRYTLLISVFIGITNIIPFFGPYLGAIPSAFLIMLENPMHGLYFVIFIIVLQQLDGNILGPKILGSSTGLSAFWVVIAILIGSGLFGFIGMIMGVPTFAVLYYLFHMIVDEKLKKKDMPIPSEEYIKVARVDINTKEMQEIQPKQKEKVEVKESKALKALKQKYSEISEKISEKGE